MFGRVEHVERVEERELGLRVGVGVGEWNCNFLDFCFVNAETQSRRGLFWSPCADKDTSKRLFWKTVPHIIKLPVTQTLVKLL